MVNVVGEKIQEFGGVRYYLCGGYYRSKGKLLHREIYKRNHGAIPKGYHIHHIDGDTGNNRIENLLLVSAHDHESYHKNTPAMLAYAKMQAERIRPLAAAWHGSNAGRQWHSEHCKEIWNRRKPAEYECTQCGKTFESTRVFGKNENTFCSNNCKAQYRRISGVDDEQRTCPVCGDTFTVNKYARAATCSRLCGAQWRKVNAHQVHKAIGAC